MAIVFDWYENPNASSEEEALGFSYQSNTIAITSYQFKCVTSS